MYKIICDVLFFCFRMSFRSGSSVTIRTRFNGQSKVFELSHPSFLDLRIALASLYGVDITENHSIIVCRNNKVYSIVHDRDVEEIGGKTGQEDLFICDKLTSSTYLRNIELDLSEIEYCTREDHTFLQPSPSTLSADSLANFLKYGYHKIKLNPDQLKKVHAMFDVFNRFCQSIEKDKYSYASLKHTQPKFGYRQTELRKEYFVCRQIPTELRDTLNYPSFEFENTFNMAFQMYSEVSRDLLSDILNQLHIGATPCWGKERHSFPIQELRGNTDTIDKIMHEITSPAKTPDVFGFTCMMEVFRYDCFGSKNTFRIPCGDHTDASLLTIIPKCLGPPGLEVFNWFTGAWEMVEASNEADECVVLAGELLYRLTAGKIAPTSHRVVIEQYPVKDIARFSCPFEIMLNPHYEIDCKKLFPEDRISDEFAIIETSPDYISRVSQKLVSVNK